MFHGWKIVAALFVILTFSSGLGFYNHAILLQALAENPAFPIATTSGAVSLFFLTTGVTGLAIAPLLDRVDIRLVMVPGALLASVSLYLVGRVATVAELYVVYIAFGVGFCASGLVPSTTLVARWFQHRRARALSIASTGLSAGGVVVTPLSAYLIGRLGMADACLALAVCYAAGVVPLAALVLRSRPADLGLEPDGGTGGGQGGMSDGILVRDALRHPYFWLLSVGYVFVMAAQVGGIAHQYGIASERLTVSQAAFAIALLPMFSIAGRLVGGFVLERVSIVAFTLSMMVMQSLSLAIIAFVDHPLALYAGLSLFGITVGNLLMLQPLLIAEVYGLAHYARLFAISTFVTQVGVAAGPTLLGTLYAATGSYHVPYLVAAVVAATACVIYAFARPPAAAPRLVG